MDLISILQDDINGNDYIIGKDIKVKLLKIQYLKKSNTLRILLKSVNDLNNNVKDKIKFLVCKKFGSFNDVEILCYKCISNVTLEEVSQRYWIELVNIINDFSPICRQCLLECSKQIDGDNLNIYYGNKFMHELLKKENICKIVHYVTKEIFGIDANINFIYDKNIDAIEYLKKSRDYEKKYMKKIIKGNCVCAQDQVARPGSDYKKKNLDNEVMHFNFTQSNNSIILGKNISGNVVDIKSLNDASGVVVVCGDIFKKEIIETKTGRKIVSFYITDYTGSITIEFFPKPKDAGRIIDQIKEGLHCKVMGEVVNDIYAREAVIMAKDIVKCERIERMDTSDEKRVELHLHTQMSAMDGMTSASDLINRAAKWGHKAIAITDHGVVQAYPEAMDAAKKNNIKVIYGIEAYLVDDCVPVIINGHDRTLNLDINKQPTYHLIILVKNQVGLKNLYKLVSISNLKCFFKRPRMPKSTIMKYREGLIIGSACDAGQVYREIINGKSDDELNKIIDFYDYLEIQPTGNNMFMVRNKSVKDVEELQDINKRICRLADKNNIPAVATCDVHFMDPKDEIFRRIIMNSQGFSDADEQAPLYFRTTEEMLREFEYLGEEKCREVVIYNTQKIADMVQNVNPIPDATFPPKIDGAEEQIKSMTLEKAHRIYGENLPHIVYERLEKELSSIINNGYAVLYLIAEKLVAKSYKDGYLVGSRGSVGSSFVATMSNITEVNGLPPHYVCPHCRYSEFITDGSVDSGADLPDKVCPKCGANLKKDGHDIPFETFLGFAGDKEPDIDLDFSGEYQPVIHKYTEELFGKGHVFGAGTIETISEKTAYGFVKKYLQERNIKVSQAEVERLSVGCTGIKKTTGQHPGGIMIVPRYNEIYNFTPVQYPADDNKKHIITTHFDYHSISGTLLKLDILGHDGPTVLRMLQDLTGVDPRTIPLGDHKVMSLFTSPGALGVTEEELGCPVGTYGIPEFETEFVRQMLVDTRPKTFADLVKIFGLSHGTDVWINNAQYYIKEGYTTLKDCIACRDDILMYLIYMGLPPKTSFSIMEKVRKGKGISEEHESIMRKYNVPHWYIQSCKKIKYMFPKGHAVAYVMMAVRLAYFKVYYPEAYYATYFTVRADEFDIDAVMGGEEVIKKKMDEFYDMGNGISRRGKNLLIILELCYEMYKRGFKFLNVDLYKSDMSKFLIEKGGIRIPLTALQGFGESTAKSIVDSRKKRKFISREDLRLRAKISKNVLEILDKHGCLNGLPETNQLSMFN